MQTVRTYKKGGFFGNSFEKFEDMPGSEKTGSMFDKNRFGFGTKGGALRREKRYLKDLEDRGGLKGSQAERLDYLKKVQKDRAKKGIAGAALAAGAAFGAPAVLGAIQGAGGLSGLAGTVGTKLAAKGGLGQILKTIKTGADAAKSIKGLTGAQDEVLDTDIEQEISDIESREYGGKILKMGGLVGGQKRLDKNSDGKLTREDFELLRAMFGAKLPR